MNKREREKLCWDLIEDGRNAALRAQNITNDRSLERRVECLEKAVALLQEARDLLDEQLWCRWCDRPRSSCRCADDPNGIPAGHWSLEAKA